MIYLYNGILLVVGLPLLGTSLLLIGVLFSSGLRHEIGGAGLLQMSLIWVISLAIFSVIYKFRAQWLAKEGILLSWGTFTGFVKEQHPCPKVPDEDYVRFRTWLKSAGLEDQDMKTIYRSIHKECPDYKKQFIYGLLRYFDSKDFLGFKESEFREGQADRFVKVIEDATGFKKPSGTNSVEWLNGLLKDRAFALKLIEMGKLSPEAAKWIRDGRMDPTEIRSILEDTFPQEAPCLPEPDE
ncbi:MAG: hypothetical protein WCH62_07725 [Candidatus Omnitrophota bacterium]